MRPEPKWYQGPIAKADLADGVEERTALAAGNPSSCGATGSHADQILSAETSGRRDMKAVCNC